MESLKTIELIYEWQNTSYNVFYKWYLITEKGLFEAREIGSNGFLDIRNFATKKEAKKYLLETIDSHKRFFNIK